MGYIFVLLLFLKYIIATTSIIAILVFPFVAFATGKAYMAGLIAANVFLWLQVIVFFELDIISYSFLKEFYINAVMAILVLGLYLVKYLRQTE